jgi:short-subunit dehydrogenase
MLCFSTANAPIKHWKNKRVWMVGASSGIGLAVAQSLQAQGARLTISARHIDKAQWHHDMSVDFLEMDICQIEQIQTAIEQLTDVIDVVMIFAGAYTAGALSRQNVNDINSTINTNLLGVIHLSQALIPKLTNQKDGAHLVIVGSAAAYLPMPNGAVYGASKAGIAYFAQSLYTELKPLGINVSLVSPGFVRTRLTAQNTFVMPSLMSTQQASDAILNGLAKGTFDIAFPKGFTRMMRVINALPWCLRQWILNRLNQQETQ